MAKQIILNHEEAEIKLRRIAHQIYESNVNEKHVVLAGIVDNGYIVAKQIAHYLDNISDLEVELCQVFVDKKKPLNSIKTSMCAQDYTNKSVVLVDDVMLSGSTLIYGVRHFLSVPLKSFKTAILIDRNHKKFPIKADFKGLSLSTSMNEHVEVIFKGNKFEAYLS